MATHPPDPTICVAVPAPAAAGPSADGPPASLESLYRVAVDRGDRAILILDPGGKVLYANDLCAGLLGFESVARLQSPNGLARVIEGADTTRSQLRFTPGVSRCQVIGRDGTSRALECQVREIAWQGDTARHCELIDLARKPDVPGRGLQEDFKPQRVGFSITTPDTRIVDVNARLCEILGYSRAEMLAVKWPDITHPDDIQTNIDLFSRSLAGELDDYSLEKRFICKNGAIRHIRITAHCVRRADATAEYFQVAYEDITDRKVAEAALRENEQRFKGFAAAAADYFWELDEHLRVTYLSERFEEITGIPPAKLIGRTRREGFGEYMDEPDKWDLGESLMNERKMYSMEYAVQLPNGSARMLRTTGKPFYNEEGVFKGYRGAGTDITEMHRLAAELSYQAHHDALTGLENRHTFEERLQRALRSASESAAQHALCYMDLDQFKVINDTCGHVAGDQLLRQLGASLGEHIRARDTLARLGGDEFGLLLEHCSLEKARAVANNLRQAIEELGFVWSGQIFNVGISIGLVPIVGSGQTVGDLLRVADTACYAAKELGRNRIHVYHPADADVIKRHGEMQWVTRINQALDENRFRLAYQQIVQIGGPRQSGFHCEMLVRLLDENGTLVPPGAFLPAAERYGLGTRIDRWVVAATFDWLRRHPDAVERISLCSINLSGHSLNSSELFGDLIGLLESSRLPAHKFCFEVTETAAISNLGAANHFIQEVRKRGCRFALDDFGSGLSSFAYLKNLAVDFVKIDGVFVKDIVDDAIDFSMVKSINEIAHIMGTRTIAEFVENDAILQLLRRIGVDFAQGYGVGRPRPLADLAGEIGAAELSTQAD